MTISVARSEERKMVPSKVEPSSEGKSRPRDVSSKRMWIRALLFLGIAVHAVTTRSLYITGSFAASALVYAGVLALVKSLPAFGNDEAGQLFTKRVMSLVSSLAVGSVAAYVTLSGHAVEAAVGVHVGVYFVDTFTFSDQQLTINALIFHHVSLYLSALFLIYLEKYTVLILISFQELSNPFWYGHMVLKLHLRASEAILFYSRFSTLMAYLFVRFAYGLPTYFKLQWAVLETMSAESLFHWFTILSFIGISANNIMKVCRS